MLAAMCDVTRILDVIHQGDAQAAAHLLPLVYDELRRLGAARLARGQPGQTGKPWRRIRPFRTTLALADSPQPACHPARQRIAMPGPAGAPVP
jgi:hypothetical protein